VRSASHRSASAVTARSADAAYLTLAAADEMASELAAFAFY
jgi:hypothetical protein